jgi:hypothetical protein
MRLITANSFGEDPQEISYTEFGGGDYVESSEKEIENVADESFAVGNGTKGDFISLKMAGKRSISCYAAEIMIFMDMNMKSGFTNSWTTPINLSR